MARHRSRHRAVQVLYQIDVRDIPPDEAIKNYYNGLSSDESDEPVGHDAFMEELVRGTIVRRAEIDKLVQEAAENWRIERMPPVDRNLLRMAIYELLQAKLPSAVVIDEALDLARRFSGEESVGFVNGVLDRVRKGLPTSEAPTQREE